jgi:hypothetical protein
MVIPRLYAPIEASNFPKWREGRRLAYPTSGLLLLRAEDRLRLFRFPLTRDTLPLSASAPIRVNSTGGTLTLRLIRLRGTPPPRNKFRGIPGSIPGITQRFYNYSSCRIATNCYCLSTMPSCSRNHRRLCRSLKYTIYLFSDYRIIKSVVGRHLSSSILPSLRSSSIISTSSPMSHLIFLCSSMTSDFLCSRALACILTLFAWLFLCPSQRSLSLEWLWMHFALSRFLLAKIDLIFQHDSSFCVFYGTLGILFLILLRLVTLLLGTLELPLFLYLSHIFLHPI